MTWWQWTIFAVAMLCSMYALIAVVGYRLQQAKLQSVPADSYGKVNFDTPQGREMLRTLIDRYGITGSCDVRDGAVHAAIQPGTRHATAAALMSVYRRVVDQTQNANLMIYTQQRGVLIPLGFDLATLREIAEMLETTRGR